ncbi:F-box/kelch-repeat protein At1g80440-like [Impatiens glandulifera]|uniref:F-box/kelch-repeat protein At1g80440-like n=1 Tax=Impatiens glandulifera TaxID=253017 RepID=UPI001FB0F27B|nr:F-box/kelch-repeat protein At1g80440-like [Impatiens glandulifera]
MKPSRLPEDLILECLVRLPRKSRYTASLVCRKWLQLIKSRQFYLLRKQLGLIKHLACLLLAPPEMRSDQPLPIVSSQRKLVLLNSCDPLVSSLSNSLFVFDFSTGLWRQGKSLPTRKYYFAMAASDDCRVFVAGGFSLSNSFPGD